ncbi:hemerythrin domain-containing protein [Nonomuraea sp. NPDC049695]|uniref:hemerythrin domain-containing protein n=1 Tax=Nonomuraea sp. NPDC049695 TaxID=3154734 RepID=UPI0034214FF6
MPSADNTGNTTMPSVTVDRPYTHEMVIVHRVFRREAALMPRLVRAVPTGDSARTAKVADYVQEYMDGLHHHHSLEDELIWPLLRSRAGAQDDLVARMELQHHAIDETLTQATALLLRWRTSGGDPAAGAELAAALDEHQTVLTEHLDDEERLVLPLVAEHMTVAEWDLVGTRGLETIPKNKMLIALGAILEDASAEEQAYFLRKAPTVGRLLWRLVGRRQYAARCRDLRGPL